MQSSGQLRRRLLKAVLGSFLLAPFAQAARRFAPRPVDAFQAETVDDALRALFGDVEIPSSEAIRVVAAELAENGAVVPIKIETRLQGVTAVSIVATENPVPLVAKFILGTTIGGVIATRIKLAKSCEVIAVVETGDGLYQARKTIEVTIGGCGV